MKEEIRWESLETFDGEGSIKQHAFKSKERKKPWTGEKYIGVISLCGKINASEDGETSISIDKLANESINPKACKNCLKAYNKLKAREE